MHGHLDYIYIYL